MNHTQKFIKNNIFILFLLLCLLINNSQGMEEGKEQEKGNEQPGNGLTTFVARLLSPRGSPGSSLCPRTLLAPLRDANDAQGRTQKGKANLAFPKDVYTRLAHKGSDVKRTSLYLTKLR